jgi:putative Ca2+/H+ antiporter (TMEM165/GDT1 family)
MNVGTFLGIFALMFVLELPDKTFVATVIMSTKARPLMVAIGASLALSVQMALAVGAGSLLTLFPVHWKDLIVGLLFLAGGAYLLFVPESEEEKKGRREAALEKVTSHWKEITTAFVVILLASSVISPRFRPRTSRPSSTSPSRSSSRPPWRLFACRSSGPIAGAPCSASYL